MYALFVVQVYKSIQNFLVIVIMSTFSVTWFRTQMDLRLCKTEGSKRSTINEKGGSIGSKIKDKFIQNA